MLAAIERDAPEAEVTIADINSTISVPERHGKQVGEGWLQNLQHFDVIIRSPGIPPQPALHAVKDKLTNTTQIFLDTVAGTGAVVIGITGSKGKSTTSSLIHHILQEGGRESLLVGNIGEPAIAHIDAAKDGMIFVHEMSSYQLMDVHSSPAMAVITAFFPEHLDYHGSLDAYRDAKTNIGRFQEPEDVIFYDAASEGARMIAEESQGRKVPFTMNDCPVAIQETQLIGAHNLRNMGAAFLVARSLSIPVETCISALRSFKPLPHRLQLVSEAKGIRWVDDAISTTPESAIAAIDALDGHVGSIILGGQDRGYDFAPLGERIAHSTIATVILVPDSGTTIEAALRSAKAKAHIEHAPTMQEAVRLAALHTPKGTTCLLSPASPSYNMFKNFEERGRVFAESIAALA